MAKLGQKVPFMLQRESVSQYVTYNSADGATTYI